MIRGLAHHRPHIEEGDDNVSFPFSNVDGVVVAASASVLVQPVRGGQVPHVQDNLGHQ